LENTNILHVLQFKIHRRIALWAVWSELLRRGTKYVYAMPTLFYFLCDNMAEIV